MDYDEVLEKARQIAEQTYPDESAQHKAAFANSVVYLVTGFSGGYGGPSVREHAAGRFGRGVQYSFDEAIKLLIDPNGPIFGPLTKEHERIWREEYCFDDDPRDVEDLRRRTGREPKR